MFIGSCNCHAVAFEIKTPLSDIYMCHCSICRRFSGSGGLALVIVQNKDFKWLNGQDKIKIWKKPDADWDANFCATCGSALPGKNDTDHMFVPAGLLSDDVTGLEVKHHIFVGSKAHWDEICDAGKQHDGAFMA